MLVLGTYVVVTLDSGVAVLDVTFGFSDSGATVTVVSGDKNTGAACASFGVSNVGVADGAARDKSVYLSPPELMPRSNIGS